MPINFGIPNPPRLAITNPIMFTIEMLAGLVFLLGLIVIVDKLGNVMFHSGFAKPFYIKGRRIHHNVIYLIMPIAYGIFSVFYFFGYIRLTWSLAGIQFVELALVISLCMAIDAIGDKFWPEIRKNVILHHEWIYSIIPAFLFGYMFVIVI